MRLVAVNTETKVQHRVSDDQMKELSGSRTVCGSNLDKHRKNTKPLYELMQPHLATARGAKKCENCAPWPAD